MWELARKSLALTWHQAKANQTVKLAKNEDYQVHALRNNRVVAHSLVRTFLNVPPWASSK
jgi:hypothetical protein